MLSFKQVKELSELLVGKEVVHKSGETVLCRSISWYQDKAIFWGQLPDGTSLTGVLGSLQPIIDLTKGDKITAGDLSYLSAEWGKEPLTVHEQKFMDDGV